MKPILTIHFSITIFFLFSVFSCNRSEKKIKIEVNHQLLVYMDSLQFKIDQYPEKLSNHHMFLETDLVYTNMSNDSIDIAKEIRENFYSIIVGKDSFKIKSNHLPLKLNLAPLNSINTFNITDLKTIKNKYRDKEYELKILKSYIINNKNHSIINRSKDYFFLSNSKFVSYPLLKTDTSKLEL